MADRLEKEIPELQAQLDTDKANHATALGKLKDRLKNMASDKKEFEVKMSTQDAEHASEVANAKADMEKMQAKVTDIDAQVTEQKAIMKGINEAMTLKMMEMSGCSCKNKAALLSKFGLVASK